MKINVCYRESTSDTARRLAIDLAEAIKQPVELNIKALPDAFNIGWGYQGDEDYFYLNTPKAIKETIDKYAFNKKLMAYGCPVAKTYDYKGIMWLYQKNKVKLPLIARRNKTQGGNGLRVCLCKAQIAGAIRNGYTFFKEYIKPKNEYRVHIFNNEPILTIRKEYRMTTNVTRNGEEEHIIERGIKKGLIKTAKLAMTFSSLDFGAVDIIESEEGKFYILEVNSAPALNKRMRQPYLEKIIGELKKYKVL